jgi:ABC-type lipoprotein export system ATPase subunit
MNEKRGSIWRKWDLHVHTPFSHLNNGFGDDFDNYVKTLFQKAIQLEIYAIGITDYFTIEGYKKLKIEYLENPIKLKQLFSDFEIDRISQILVLPNIEFRLKSLVNGSRINYHVIFSPDLTIQDIEEDFLHDLDFVYEGNPDDEDEKWKLKPHNISALGAKLKQEHTQFTSESDIVVGMKCAVVDDTQITKILNSKKSKFKNKVVLVAPADEDLSTISWNGQGHNVRKTLLQKANAIFASNSNSIDWGLGKKNSSIQNFINEFKSLKPAIWGSDAHDFNKLFKPDEDRFCWVKADTKFEGLLQAFIEPAERIYIGKEPAIFDRVRHHKTKYISQIEITRESSYADQYGKWFENIQIGLNPELVAIIGNKGSGKSALADIIALCGNFNQPNSYSFLHPKKFRRGNLSKNFRGKLTWESGSVLERLLCDDPEAVDLPNIKYLPQGDFELLTNEIEKTDSFQKEIENVVFSHMDEDDRLLFKDFEELIENKKAINEKAVKALQIDIVEINNEIIKLDRKKNPKYALELQGLLKQKKEELVALVEPKEIKDPNSDTLLVGLNKEILEKIEKIRVEILNIKEEISVKKEKKQEVYGEKSALQNLIQELKLKKQEIALFHTEYSDLASKYGIKIDEIISLKLNLSGLEKIVQSKDTEILKLENELGNIQSENQTDSLFFKLEKAESDLKIEQSKLDSTQKEYQDYLLEKSTYEARKDEIVGSIDKPNTIKFFEGEIDYVTFHIDKDIIAKSTLRNDLVRKIFVLKQQIITIYQTVKKRIDEKIKENKSLLENYHINIDASLVLKNDFQVKFFNYISLNKAGSFYNKESAQIQLLKVLENCDVNKFDDIELFLKRIIELLKIDNRENQNNASRYIDDQISDLDEFYAFLFSLDFLDYNYKLKLGDKHLDQLSPGERGALLLVFYLLLDKNDIPLILDQPEDNLDNHSVANVLVPFIRRAKQKRQIILVTHNPNLAIVADAEQIIWVDIDKKDKNKFEYISGSIENRVVNEKIVNVLEGAMPAFNKRKQKYYE